MGLSANSFFSVLLRNIDGHSLSLYQGDGEFLKIYPFFQSLFFQLSEAVMKEVRDLTIDVLVYFDEDPLALKPEFDGFIDDLHRHTNSC